MKTTITRILPLAAMAALLALAGCSGGDNSPTAATSVGGDDYAALDLNRTYGGLTETDEAVAFGDKALEAELDAESGTEADDPLAGDPAVRRFEAMCQGEPAPGDSVRPRITYLTLRWGMLRGPEDTTAITPPCDVTDWTGSVRTDAGVLIVKRVLRFERPYDHLIWPRLDRRTAAFVSHTACGWDGLVLEIIEPPAPAAGDSSGMGMGGPQDPPTAPNVLHIRTPLVELDIPVADLGALDRVIDVNDQGLRFQLTGFTPGEIGVCPKGFLSGRYRFVREVDRPDSTGAVRLGMLAGLWQGLDGRIEGFLRGGYGVDAAGQRVFAGKVIGRGGHFRALVHGTWEPAAGDTALATFSGEWAGAGGRVEGILGGEAHPVAGYPGGFFTGRWTALCDQEAESAVAR